MSLLKAHDVRHLCLCGLCGSIGDDREMVLVNHVELPRLGYGLWKNVPMHGACAFKKLGDGILDLPNEQRAKFTINDLGVEMMRRMVERGHRD